VTSLTINREKPSKWRIRMLRKKVEDIR